MDNKSLKCRVDLGIRSIIAGKQASNEAKEKIDAIINMAAASAKSIAGTVNISYDTLLMLLSTRLADKAEETYMSNIKRRENDVETETLDCREAE